jgi:transposase-like protein
MDLIRIATEYSTEEACLKYLEKARWPEGVRCIGKNTEGAVCGSDKITKFSTKEGKRKNGRTIPARHLYQCQTCGYQFTAKTETLFNDSHLPLVKWFIAVTLLTNAKKGMSAKQLERDLKVSYQTAWYVFHRIREAMKGEGGMPNGDRALGDNGGTAVHKAYCGSERFPPRETAGPQILTRADI